MASFDKINAGTHGRYAVPVGMILRVSPFDSSAEIVATSSVSGLGSWGPTSSATQIGPFVAFTEIVIEVRKGSALVEVAFPDVAGSTTLQGTTDYATAPIAQDNASIASALAAQDAAIADALKAPTAWAASASGGTPAISDATAVVGTAFKNTTVGTTTLTTAIGGTNQVSLGDMFICLVAGAYTYFPGGGAYLGLFGSTGALPAAASNPACFALVGSTIYFSTTTSWIAIGSGGMPTSTAWSTIWDTAGSKDMGDFTITAALALTSSDAASILGGYTMATLIADGTHIPTFDGATNPNWVNTAGARNPVTLRRTGNTKSWSIPSNVVSAAAITTPVAAAITSAPVLAADAAGSAVTWTPGTVTGTPAPTVSYSLKKNGTVVSSPATSGSYSSTTAGDILVVTQAATNAAYGGGTATPVDSAPVTVSGAGSPIGGISIGSVGTGIYSGYTLSWGDEFTSLDIVGPSKPTGYLTSRGTVSMPGARSSAASPHYYTDPLHTGYLDAGRGVPPITDTVSIQGGTRLKLAARYATTGEQATFAPSTYAGGKPVIAASAINTARKAGFYVGPSGGEVVIEAKIRHTPKATNPAGWHPTFWTFSAAPTVENVDDEWDIVEGNSQGGYFNSNTWTGGAGSSTGTAGPMDFFDGTDHIWTLVMSQTSATLYVDGTLQYTRALNTNAKALPAYVLFTSVVFNASFGGETFSQAAWSGSATGAAMEIDWVRFWRKSTAPHYKALTSVADVAVSYNGTGSVVLPSAATLWGDGTVTEYVQAIASETNDPTNDVKFIQFPPGVTYNSGTRTISIDWSASTTPPGRLVFTVQAYKSSGCTFEPLTFCVNRGPTINTTTQAWTGGQAVSIDLYGLGNVGNLLPKTLSGISLPAWLTYSSVTGLATGTAPTSETGNIGLTVTNSAGQSATASIPYTVTAASSDVPAPTGITSQTLVARWSPNVAASLTTSGSNVTQIADASGSSGVALANAANNTTNPTLVTRNGKQALRFTQSLSSFLKAASNLGIASGNAVTITAVVEFASTAGAGGQAVLDIGNSGGALAFNRFIAVCTTGSGYTYRKSDSAGTSSVAKSGTWAADGMHLMLGRSPAGTGTAAEFNLDGAGTASAGTPTSGNTVGINTVTMGWSTETSASNRYMDGWVYDILVHTHASATMSDADAEAIAVWAATNYGTTNAA